MTPSTDRDTDLNEVHLVERLIVARLLDIEYGDDVLMVEIAQELHFPERPEAKH